MDAKNELYPLVSVISVNYNQAQITIETIESLQKVSYPNLEIIIVDNASKEDPEVIVQQCPNIKFIRSDKNLGFAGGNNLGIKEARGEYVLFLNSDTEVDKDFLQPLVNLLENNPNIGIVSPKLVYFFSENKNLVQYAGSNHINLFTARGSTIGFKQQDNESFNHTIETNLPHGAAMMLPMRVIREVGLMPEIYFLYYEEHDWAHMVMRNGFKIYYCGTSTVYHKESMSVGKNNPLKVFYMNRNRLIFVRRNAKPLIAVISFLFYSFVALPVNVLKFLLKGEMKFISKIIQAYFWNITHCKVKVNPYLNEQNEIIYANFK
ncbi:glycosyltransferase family 2 protein [uncultured Draconibacterium sp.]|uniref:glycosyltransferase family 2 protein n=1 Tax=uncultured Draconibacterium sp. TaxID=1573823 RepID=UPI0025F32194|nr:glycosyltransferase family 2 protein [uncultured Draconibacterium sp.]